MYALHHVHKEDTYTMHITHYLCLSWYGRITPVTMACTMREYTMHLSMGTMPTMHPYA